MPNSLAFIACAMLFFLSPFPELRAASLLQIGQNFAGASYGVDSAALPADGNGAIGPHHFVELINGRFSVFDKTNGNKVVSMTDRVFWTAAGLTLPSNLEITDPRLVFDPGSQRWFACSVDVDAITVISNRFLLAVSAGIDPTLAWTGFAFAADPNNGSFADFPTFGIDATGVYLSGDLFDDTGNNLGATLFSIPKSGLLATPPTIAGRRNFGLLEYATHGQILQPAVTLGAPSTGEAIVAIGDIGADFKPHDTVISFNVDQGGAAGAEVLTPSTTIIVPSYSVPINPPQPDKSVNLDDGDARISATVYRVDDLLYAIHSVQVNGRAGLQWFKIGATNHALLQSGTITNSALDLFYPSIAANPAGTVMIGCNGSSTNSFVSAYAIMGETVNGALTFGNLVLLKAGTASYQNRDGTGTSRWGDYSATTLDPSDSSRFWTLQMIPTKRTVWSTQITELITRPLSLAVTETAGAIRLSWPSAAVGFQLQFTPSLSATNAWITVSEGVTTANNQFTILIPLSGSEGFFRLAKP